MSNDEFWRRMPDGRLVPLPPERVEIHTDPDGNVFYVYRPESSGEAIKRIVDRWDADDPA